MPNLTIKQIALLQKLLGDPKLARSIQSIKDKEDVVLFVGITAAGKSTSVAYMLEHDIQVEIGSSGKPRAYINKDSKIEASLTQIPEIGLTVDSCTTYVEAYKSRSGFYYCDCPGFFDTRNRIYRICTSISIQLAVQAAASVRALVVVIDWDAVTSGKSERLIELSNTLSQLLVKLSANESILFIINKTPSLDYAKEEAIKYINEKKQELKAKIESEEDDDPKQTIKACAILELISHNPENVILLNDLRNPVAREEVVNWLQRRKQQNLIFNKDNFRSERDINRVEFERVLTEVSLEGVELIKDYFKIQNDLLEQKKQLEEAKIKLLQEDSDSNIKTLLDDIFEGKGDTDKKEQDVTDVIENRLSLIKDDIKNKNIKIADLEKESGTLQKEIDILKGEVKALKEDRSWVVLESKQLTNTLFEWKRLPSWAPAWSEEIYKYQGDPFDQVDWKKIQNGHSTKEIEYKPLEGKYEVIYKSPWNQPCDALIEIKVMKNNSSLNKKLVIAKQREIENKETKILENNKDMISFRSEVKKLLQKQNGIEDIQKNVEAFKKAETEGKNEKLVEVKSKLEQYLKDNDKKQIEEVILKLKETIVKTKEKLSSKYKEILDKEGLYKLSKQLQIPELFVHGEVILDLLNSFVSEYEKLIMVEHKLIHDFQSNSIFQSRIFQELISLNEENLERLKQIEDDIGNVINSLKTRGGSENVIANAYGCLYLCRSYMQTKNREQQLIAMSVTSFKDANTNEVFIFIIEKILNREIKVKTLSILAWNSLLENELLKFWIQSFLKLSDLQQFEFLKMLVTNLNSQNDHAFILLKKLLNNFNPQGAQVFLLNNNNLLLNMIIHGRSLELSGAILEKFIIDLRQINLIVLAELMKSPQIEICKKIFAANKENIDKIKLNNNQTILAYAIQLKKYELVDCVLGSGANVNAYLEFYFPKMDGSEERYAMYPLRYAVMMGLEKIVELLLGYAPQYDIDIKNQTIFHVAIGSASIVKMLGDKNKSAVPGYLNCKDIDGYNLFLKAVKKNDVGSFRYLCGYSKDTKGEIANILNEVTRDKNNLLHLAALSQNNVLIHDVCNLNELRPYYFWAENNQKQTPVALADGKIYAHMVQIKALNIFKTLLLKLIKSESNLGDVALLSKGEWLVSNWIMCIEKVFSSTDAYDKQKERLKTLICKLSNLTDEFMAKLAKNISDCIKLKLTSDDIRLTYESEFRHGFYNNYNAVIYQGLNEYLEKHVSEAQDSEIEKLRIENVKLKQKLETKDAEIAEVEIKNEKLQTKITTLNKTLFTLFKTSLDAFELIDENLDSNPQAVRQFIQAGLASLDQISSTSAASPVLDKKPTSVSASAAATLPVHATASATAVALEELDGNKASDMRSSNAIAKVGMFATSNGIQANVIKQLLLEDPLLKKIPKGNSTVSIVFQDVEQAKQLQSKLLKIGIENPQMPGEVIKIEMSNEPGANEFTITLTSDEYNNVMGEDAYERLVSEYAVNHSASAAATAALPVQSM